MDRAELTPFAEIAIAGYFDTSIFSRSFKKEFRHPPNAMAKIQYHRSILIARLSDDDRFDLNEEYTPFGRVHFRWLETGRDYLLRSEAAVAFDNHHTDGLFDAPQQYIASDTIMLVFNFQESGLELAVAG